MPTPKSQTHESIVAAATRLFYERGFALTSMHNVCEAGAPAAQLDAVVDALVAWQEDAPGSCCSPLPWWLG